MKNNEISKLWDDIESQASSKGHFFQRLICIDLLFRVYIGTSGIPSKRFLSIEIPEKDKDLFDAFTESRGFTLTISVPAVKHEGYVSCILQAASADQNDVFTIVSKDIINELYSQRHTKEYVSVLKKRIEKWREFFKKASPKILPEKVVIGLIGELSFIKELILSGINNAVDFWNGPIKASQDFQGNSVVSEIKTVSNNQINNVHISSEIQLDKEDHKALFLIVYRIEHNDASGMKLPDFINEVSELLSERQKTRFWANLICLGYLQEDEKFYTRGYSIKERVIYEVKDEFPRILKKDLPKDVSNVKYNISLQNYSNFITDMVTIVKNIKEFENAKS